MVATTLLFCPLMTETVPLVLLVTKMVPLLELTATDAGPLPTVMVPVTAGPPKAGAAVAAGTARARTRALIAPAEASRTRGWRQAADKRTPDPVMWSHLLPRG